MNVIAKAGIAKYALSDDVFVHEARGCYATASLIISDLNPGNSTLYANVSGVPEDFRGDKYLFNGSIFSENPAYVEPAPEEEGEE
jgi:hypothetical protein